MNIQLLYFASLSETLGIKTETIDTDLIESDSMRAGTQELTITKLKTYLATRGDNWQIFLSSNNLLCAVNQTMANNDTIIQTNQEVAFFPPVTGG